MDFLGDLVIAGSIILLSLVLDDVLTKIRNILSDIYERMK